MQNSQPISVETIYNFWKMGSADARNLDFYTILSEKCQNCQCLEGPISLTDHSRKMLLLPLE